MRLTFLTSFQDVDYADMVADVCPFIFVVYLIASFVPSTSADEFKSKYILYIYWSIANGSYRNR